MTAVFDGYKVANDTFIYALAPNGCFERVFGKGIAALLRKISSSNSVNEACADLGLSYTKAMRMIKRTEQTLSIVLLDRHKGGSGREGSRLSDDAVRLLELFDELESRNRKAALENSIAFLEELEQEIEG